MCLLSRKRQLSSTLIILVSIIAATGAVTAVSGRGEERCVRQLRLDPASLRDPKIKAALVNHLDRQNKEPIHGEEEDFADDTSWLSDTVARIVDWNDPRQVCVLAISVDLPDQLGDHAKVAVPASCDGLRTA
jgi:hypothetical protein